MRAVVVMLLGLLAACPTKANPNQCCTDQADCAAHGIPVGTSCGQGLVCRGNQCIAEVCTSSTDCDLSAPFCVASSCMAMCTADDQCPGNGGNAANVHCVGGACVACRANASDCPATAPVCDMGACRGCTADAECSSLACDLDGGTCLDATALVYASPAGSSTSSCSQADPCTLSRAFAVIDASRPNIKLAPGTYTTVETFTGTYALTVYGPGTLPGMTITSNGGSLRLRDLSSNGIVVCTPTASTATIPTLDADRVDITVDTTFGSAIGADQCVVHLSRISITATGSNAALTFEGYGGAGASTVTADRLHVIGGDPAISLTNQSTMTITNSVFERQGTVVGAIRLGTSGTGGESGAISFSTFYNSNMICPTGNTILASSNNIYFHETTGASTNTVTGTACTHSYDLIKPQATAPTGTNLVNMDPRFVNAATGDFHLMLGSPAIDAADPAATLGTDYDGTARPQGAARDIGAFEYKP